MTNWKILLLLLAAIVAAGAWVIADSLATARLEATLKDLKAAGYATSLEEMAPPEIDEKDNAAQVYLAAFDNLAEPSDVDAAIQQMHQGGFASLTDDQTKSIQAWLEKDKAAFEGLRLARAIPKCRYERDYSKGWAILLPEISKTIAAGRSLCWRAEILAARGDANGARASIRDAVAVEETLRDDPFLVSQLVRNVVVNKVCLAVDRCVTEGSGDADLKAWLDALPSAGCVDGELERAYRGELAMVTWFNAHSIEIWAAEESRVPSWVIQSLRPILRNDLCLHSRTLRRCVEASRKPYIEARSDFQIIEKETESLNRHLHPVTAIVMPSLTHALENQTNTKAALVVTRAGLECERAFRADGKYPEKIEAIDPFTGKPLLYLPDKGVLYSVGRDGKDDGGEKENPDAKGDVVWKLRHH